ncbi:MAG: hypothetical protein ABL890_02650 [Candidatus Peribacteraceae bacterium]
MLSPDLSYLQRIRARTDPASLLREPQFLEAQKLFFTVIHELGWTVDFDLADMREVHAVAALGEKVQDARVLDIGCGSTEAYVLGNSFRDLYPPYFAEMLTKLGAHVTGIDIRENPEASYDHRVLDSTKGDWTATLEPPYDLVLGLSLFNAPESAYEKSRERCDELMRDMHGLLADDGLLIVTLRDEMFADASKAHTKTESYLNAHEYSLLHLDLNTAWAKKS